MQNTMNYTVSNTKQSMSISRTVTVQHCIQNLLDIGGVPLSLNKTWR